MILLNEDKTLQCDGYFLKNLDIETLYTLKIDIFGDNLSCYIQDEKKLPKFPRGNINFEVKKEDVPKEIQERIKQFEKMKQQ